MTNDNIKWYIKHQTFVTNGFTEICLKKQMVGWHGNSEANEFLTCELRRNGFLDIRFKKQWFSCHKI